MNRRARYALLGALIVGAVIACGRTFGPAGQCLHLGDCGGMAAAGNGSNLPIRNGVAGAGGSSSTAGTGAAGAQPCTCTDRDAPLTASLRVAVIGDYGQDNPDEAGVAELVARWKPDVVVTTGDNNYPLGEEATIDQNIGKYFHPFIGNYRGKYGKGSPVNRFWPSLGNHDWETAEAAPYRDYFTLPGNERYYDVDLGIVHLFAIDSDPREPDGTTAESKQALWLKSKLAASRSCYDLVYFHHPPYSSGAHGSSDSMRWPFADWGAEAVFSGHDHTYERFQIGRVPYLVVGLGGASIYGFDNPTSESLAQYNQKHGALLVTATRDSLQFQFFDTDGTLHDTHTEPNRCRAERRKH